jgi:cell division initiation protein
MRLTPLDIRGQEFRRVMRGLDPEEVEQFLATIATEFETLLSEVQELRQRNVELGGHIEEYKSMEKALRDTLLTAEKLMGEAKESAQREASLIVREAELSAQRAKARLTQDLTELRHEVEEIRRIKDAYLSRVRWLLRSNLETLDGHAQEFEEIDASLRPAVPAADWPRGPVSEPPPPAGEPHGVAGSFYSGSLHEPPADRGTWQPPRPSATAPAGDLDDVLRPVSPDGSYEMPQPMEPTALSVPPPLSVSTRVTTAEDLAQAARRAERLAAEARAAYERHATTPPAGAPDDARDAGWPPLRYRDPSGPRSGGPMEDGS